MSDRLDFHELREGTYDDYEDICLVKDEGTANKLLKILQAHSPESQFYIHHVKIVATTDLSFGDY